MEERTHYDKRMKQYIKDKLYAYIYAPIETHLQKQLDSIIQKNSVLIGASHNSFMYKGNYYACDTTNPPSRMNTLIKQLHPAMDDYLKEQKKLNNTELPYVLGFINQVLNASDDLQDYLRVFPDSIHKPLEQIINSCPCRNKHLSEEDVITLQNKNKASIDLMKQRMFTNLLI